MKDNPFVRMLGVVIVILYLSRLFQINRKPRIPEPTDKRYDDWKMNND